MGLILFPLAMALAVQHTHDFPCKTGASVGGLPLLPAYGLVSILDHPPAVH